MHTRPRSSLALRLGEDFVEGVCRVFSRIVKLHHLARPAMHGVEVIPDVAYTEEGGRDHRLDIYRPLNRTSGPSPSVLYVHGGGFTMLSKETHWVMGLGFARRGFTVFNINYRLAPRHPYPAAIQDTCRAFLWLAEHARDYGADPSRPVLAGESAGANLVTSLALCCCYKRPEPWARAVWERGLVPGALIPACGLLQVSEPERFWRKEPMPFVLRKRLLSVVRSYIAPGCGQNPGGIELADPLVVLEEGRPSDRPLPPFFAPVGTDDRLVADHRRLESALGRLDVACEARYYPREGHAFHAFVWRRLARQCWADTYRFLDRHLGAGSAEEG